MRMRRALALLCALFCIWSSLFSAAFAVDTLEDLEIDPWGDLGLIQETPEPTPTAPIGEPAFQDPVELEPAGEGGSPILRSLPSSTLRFSMGSGAYFYYSNSGTVRPSASGTSSSSTFSAYSALAQTNGYFSFNFPAASNSYYSAFIPVNLPVNEYESITLNGYLSSYVTAYISNNGGYRGYCTPDYVGVYINGSRIGDYVYLSKVQINPSTTIDAFVFKKAVYNISSHYNGAAITSVELRFFSSTGTTTINHTITSSESGKYVNFDYYFSSSNLGISQQKLDLSGVGGGADDNPGSTAEQDQQRHEETKGLLNSIIAFLQSIINGIGNIATAIAQLPGKIANLIIEGIKSLFIPSEDDLNGLKDQYEALLSERLGFIWQAGEWITSFGSDLLSALSGGSEAEFVFPGVGFDMNGEHYQLIEQQTVDFDSNGIVTVIRPFVGTIVALVVVAACVNLFHDMVGALISGKSYFDFLKGGGG